MENIEQHKVPEQNPLPEIRFTTEGQYNEKQLAVLRKPLIKQKAEVLAQLEREGISPSEYLGPRYEQLKKSPR